MQASFSTKTDNNTLNWMHGLDARSKMTVCMLTALATVALSNAWAQLALFIASLVYFFSIRRWTVVAFTYIMMALMACLSFFCIWLISLWMPSAEKSMNAIALAVPFMRGCTMMNVVLPLAFSTRVQSILHSLQALKLPFCIYLPAAVMIRFIPTFASDIRQVWESLKIRGWHITPWMFTMHPVMATRLLFTPLLFRSLKTSDELGIAAELKGLGYGAVMQSYRASRWGRKDWLLIGAVLLVCVVAFCIQINVPNPMTGGMK